MANTLFLDLFSGISGDMLLGALIDLGVDFSGLEKQLATLHIDGCHLHLSRQERSGICGAKFDVHLAHADHGHGHGHPGHDGGHDEPADGHEHGHGHGHSHAHEAGEDDHHHNHYHHHHEEEEGAHEQEHEHDETGHHHHGHHHHDEEADAPAHEPAAEHAHHGRNFAQIARLIQESSLSDWTKTKAIAVFRRIAEAEGRIHGHPPEEVHFHEVGAIDSIVDIVGACLALEALGKPRVLASAITDGTGWLDCQHGRLPLPAPATLAILGARGVPITQCEEPFELVTPTGAALLAEFVENFGPLVDFKPVRIGYGVGTRQLKHRPNVLRAVLGESGAADRDWEVDRVALLETNLDDLPAEVLGHFMEQAFARGARDVFYTAIQMKKNRPGILLSVLCQPGQEDLFTELILRETSAFGVRRSLLERRKLRREFRTVDTPFGPLTVKLGRLDGRVLHATPEYESARQLALQAGVPLHQVYAAAAKLGSAYD
jgi:uncharacterized protein (TIGR00299 family) protein